MLLNSVLNDAVSIGHTDLHYTAAQLGHCWDIPFTQEDVQRRDNAHVLLCILLELQGSMQRAQIRTTLPIFRGAEMQRCRGWASCANFTGKTPEL